MTGPIDFDKPGRFAGVCSHCGQTFVLTPRNDYMLQPRLWSALHPEGEAGFLHDSCLLARCREAGVSLDASSFTASLCYVNRRIHFADARAREQALTQRLARNEAHRRARGLRALPAARELKHILGVFEQEDAWARRPESGESPLAHLFA